MSDWEIEQLCWDGEVGAEAARLIRAGMAPWRARARAGEIASARRQQEQIGRGDRSEGD